MNTVLFQYRASFIVTLAAGNLVALLCSGLLAHPRLYVLPLLALIIGGSILFTAHTEYFAQRQHTYERLKLPVLGVFLLVLLLLVPPMAVLAFSANLWNLLAVNGVLLVFVLWPVLSSGIYTEEQYAALPRDGGPV